MSEGTYEDSSVRDAISDLTPTPIPTPRWVDAGGGVWEEHPADATRIRFVHDAEGNSPSAADYWLLHTVEKQFGGLTRQVPEDDGMVVRTATGPLRVKPGDRVQHITHAWIGVVRAVGPNALDVKIDDDVEATWTGASWHWKLLPVEDTGTSTDEAVDVYVNGKLVRSEPETVEQRKIREAADQLEDIIVMAKQVVLELRGASRRAGYGAIQSAQALYDSYAYLFALRRKLGRTVATIGAGQPHRVKQFEAALDELVAVEPVVVEPVIEPAATNDERERLHAALRSSTD